MDMMNKTEVKHAGYGDRLILTKNWLGYLDQGVGDVEYSRARIHLGNFSQDSTELAPGTIVDQGVGDVEDTRVSVSLQDSLEDSAYFTHLFTGYSDSNVECQRLNSASTSHSVSDTPDGVTLPVIIVGYLLATHSWVPAWALLHSGPWTLWAGMNFAQSRTPCSRQHCQQPAMPQRKCLWVVPRTTPNPQYLTVSS